MSKINEITKTIFSNVLDLIEKHGVDYVLNFIEQVDGCTSNKKYDELFVISTIIKQSLNILNVPSDIFFSSKPYENKKQCRICIIHLINYYLPQKTDGEIAEILGLKKTSRSYVNDLKNNYSNKINNMNSKVGKTITQIKNILNH